MSFDRARCVELLLSDDRGQRAQGRELALSWLGHHEGTLLIAACGRSRQLLELDLYIEKADGKASYTAVASLMGQKGRLMGLDQPTPPPAPEPTDVEPPADPADHRRQLLLACRRNRLQAEADHSWVAAARFLEQERELLSAEGAGEGAEASDSELLARLEAAVKRLPPALQDLILPILAAVAAAPPETA